jgi:hypothetical protein
MSTEPIDEEILKQLATDVEMLKAAAKVPGTDKPCIRDDEVRKILGRTAELLRGVTALGRERNVVTLTIVLRTILENLIVLLWVLVSEENVQQQSMAGLAEMRRITRINLEKGNAKIFTKATGEDATAEFLASGSLKGSSSKNLDRCAREADVSSLYDALYRPLSMAVHAHGFDPDDSSDEPEVEAELHAAGAFAKAIGHVGMRWLVHRQRTDNEALREVLGLNTK